MIVEEEVELEPPSGCWLTVTIDLCLSGVVPHIHTCRLCFARIINNAIDCCAARLTACFPSKPRVLVLYSVFSLL